MVDVATLCIAGMWYFPCQKFPGLRYLPETNSHFAPENMPGPQQQTIIFQASFLRCYVSYVSFREGISSSLSTDLCLCCPLIPFVGNPVDALAKQKKVGISVFITKNTRKKRTERYNQMHQPAREKKMNHETQSTTVLQNAVSMLPCWIFQGGCNGAHPTYSKGRPCQLDGFFPPNVQWFQVEPWTPETFTWNIEQFPWNIGTNQGI